MVLNNVGPVKVMKMVLGMTMAGPGKDNALSSKLHGYRTLVGSEIR